MKELEYPFDAGFLLGHKKKLKRQLLDAREVFIDKKIAVLGGSTTNDIILMLELFLLNEGIRPQFYESEYDQYYQEIMFENKELERFAPDLIYIYTTNRNISKYPLIADTAETIDSLMQAEMTKFTGMWDRLAQIYHCPGLI